MRSGLRFPGRVAVGCALFALGAAGAVLADTDSVTVLVRNARIIDPNEERESIPVNLLVEEGELSLVTGDEVPPSEDVLLVFDARGGFVLGNLTLGEPAGFLILDSDPREDVTILLDTASHVTFAIHEGELIRNTLLPVTGEEAAAAEEEKKTGWMAYTPPPMALPLSYGEKNRWNQWESRWVSGLFLGTVFLDRMGWLHQDEVSQAQVGDLEEYDGGEIRGLRFGVIGTINFERPWIYTLFAATNAFDKGFDTTQDDNLTLFDYRIDAALPRGVFVSVGKQKEPISRERVTTLIFEPMQERSTAADAMMPSRNVGIVVSGTGFGKRMTWAGGVFNDWFDAGQRFDESASQLAARITGLALGATDESHVVHVGIGGRYTDAKEGIRYGTEPEFNQAPVFVDTEELPAEQAYTVDLELAWRRGPFWAGGEYVFSALDAPPLGNPRFSGYHVFGTWALTGEMRSYNRKAGVFGPLPVARTVHQGGWGAWEVAARWSDLDLDDGPVQGGRVGIASAGLTWWLTPLFSASLNYRHIRLDRGGIVGHSDGVNMRLLLTLE